MIKSMTGFAATTGAGLGWNWGWEMRGVNARGLDVRLRLPDWIDGLEAALRGRIKGRVARGNVTISLRMQRDPSAEEPGPDDETLDRLLAALRRIEARAAEAHGLKLAPTSAAQVMGLRSGTEAAGRPEGIETAPLREMLETEFSALVDAFDAMRTEEGAALAAVIGAQLDEIEALTEQAAAAAAGRRDKMAETLRDNLARVLENADGADPDRVAQELALMAVKADVTEEIDRLRAHVEAARGLLAAGGPVGRKLDFLTQEFNREANTLCSKAQDVALTRIGLDLKAVIDQMREQVQNVE